MKNRKILIPGLCIVFLATAVMALAQSPIINPSFEDGLDGWTPYSFSVGLDGHPALPQAGSIGPQPCPFDLLQPASTPDGTSVCGLQSSTDALNGGVYQFFTWGGGPATIEVTARSYSTRFDLVPWDNGCRVQMGLAFTMTMNRNEADSWVTFPWSDGWNTRSLTVPGPGSYTLFIEDYQPSPNAIMSTLWDNIVLIPLPPILVTSGPTITADPSHPDSAVNITWTTDVASASHVNYGPTTAYGQSVDNQASVTSHSVTVSGLAHSSSYHFRVTSTAPDNESYVSDDMAYKTPIQISNISTGLTPDGASTIIAWNTDVPTTTQVEYGLTAGYGTTTAEDTALKTTHEVTLAGLAENSNYHFRVWGRNKPLYTDASSADQILHTLPTPSITLQNGGFEDSHGSEGRSLYPWVQYTTITESGVRAIDGLVGPYPKGGTASWFAGVQAFAGSYFLGAAASADFKNGGVFQRVFCAPGQLCALTARFATYMVGGVEQDNRVRLGIDPTGGVDPEGSTIEWWSGSSPTNDNQWHAAATMSTAGANGLVTVFVDIRQQWPLQWHLMAIDNVTLAPPLPMTLGQLKSSTGSLSAILTDEIVTYVAPNPVAYGGKSYRKVYAQESDRSAGLAILLLNTVGADIPTKGNKISLTASLIVPRQEAMLMAHEWTVDHNTYPVEPLGMNQKCIGGATVNQLALPYGSSGLCNVGLLVRVFGKITQADYPGIPGMDMSVKIDDGSGLQDPGNEAGLRAFLIAKQDAAPNIGDYLAATGVLTIQTVNPTGNPGDEYYVYRVQTGAPEDWDIIPSTAPLVALSSPSSAGAAGPAIPLPRPPEPRLPRRHRVTH